MVRTDPFNIIEITGVTTDATRDGLAVLVHSPPVGVLLQGVAGILHLTIGDDGQAQLASRINRLAQNIALTESGRLGLANESGCKQKTRHH